MLFNLTMFILMVFIYMFSNFQFLFMYLSLVLIFIMMIKNFNLSMFFMGSSSLVYGDFLSFILSFLSLMIILFMILLTYFKKLKESLLVNFFLLVSLYLCFFSNSFLMMYVCFEISLVPLIYLIFMNGFSLERFKASMYLFLFTLFGSFFLLLSILSMKGSLLMGQSNYSLFLLNKSGLIWGLMFLVFLVKMPMYSVHMWLPKAHVEAPVEGSMILAGVLLKLGGFGLSRLMNFLKLNSFIILLLLLISISLIGSLVISLICLRQLDLKMLIAYSSVSHMGMLLGGVLSNNQLGMLSGMSSLLSHGFCSSALFYMSGIFYERYKTRNLFLMKGCVQVFPLLMVNWLFFSVFNMGTPPSLNFFCELILVFSLLKKSLILGIILGLILVFSVFYMLNLFLSLGHGSLWFMNYSKKDSFLEMFILSIHFYYLLFFFLKNSVFVINM